MTQHVERVCFLFVGDDGNVCVMADGAVEIPQIAVNADHHGRLGETGTDRGGDFHARDRVVIFADGTVRKGDRNNYFVPDKIRDLSGS